MVIKITKQVTSANPKEDNFAKLLGDFGKWQFLIFGTVSLVKLSSGWVQMAILFLTPNLVYRCVNLPNSTQEILNSTCYKGCEEYEYDASPFENTIVSEWGLICERKWLASFTQMVLQLGILIGSIVSGFFSDRYGRKNTFLIAIFALIALGLGVPFSPNYATFTTLRFLLGFATAGTMVVSFVIVMESVGPKYREVAGCLYQLPFIVGHMSLPLFAYYFRSWNTYLLAVGVPPLIYLGYFFVLTESPRWLVSVGRVEEAAKIVTKAAAMNGLPTAKIEESLNQISLDMRSKEAPKLNYCALLAPELWLKTVCTCTMWLIAGLTFFGFNQYISQTSPDPFISVTLAGAIQIPSTVVCMWLIPKFGRKYTTATFFTFCGLCIILLYFVPKTFAYTLTLGTLGVSFASIVTITIYIFTSELYPTVIRNMGMGACSTSMRIGSMLAPFISNIDIPWLPTALFGVAPILAGLICLLLPETKGRKLPDSMDDLNRV